MTGPSVTVVVITHNRRDEVLRTLDHMTSLPDAAPIILVDNDSADGTADAVRTTHPEVRLIAAHDNLGAVARNVAVDLVTTPYVAFCDDDTRWQPGALTRGARILDRHPSIATVTGRCLVAPDLHDDPITPEMRDSPVDGPEWLPGPALLGIMAGLTMIRRSAFVAVGGFCPRFWLGGEEELLALDLAAAGWWMVWDGGMVIHHEPSLSRDAGRRRRLGIRNTLWTLWLRRPLPVAARRSAEIVASAPHDLSTLRAVTEALTGLPWVVRNRRVVPPAVERGLRSLEAPQRASTARRYVG
ncbi:MAG: glycosyltransferase [Gordonia paraffinivorans]